MTKPNVTALLNNVRTSLKENAPTITVALGITGMITTTVLAVKATPKALQLIEEAKKAKHTDKLTVIDTVKATWKCYVPAVLLGGASVGCLIWGNSENTRRNAALATAYKVSETALTEYRAKVVETLGEKKEQHIRDELDKDRLEKNPVSKNDVIVTGKGNTLFYDYNSDRYFYSDIDRVNRVVNELNRRMVTGMEMYVSLADFYDEIGLDRTPTSEDLGWTVDKGLIDVEFGSQIAKDGRPCVVLHHRNAPQYGYWKLT